MPSNPVLTVAYLTARKVPHIEWFAASLLREVGDHQDAIRVLVIDFYAEGHRDGDRWTQADADGRNHQTKGAFGIRGFSSAPFISPPIWGVWQGPHRITKDNWWAKADYLNAAIALCRTDWLAVVDDLSVLRPGWLAAAREATAWPGITCGAYRKVNALVVKDGDVESFVDHPAGMDSRVRFYGLRDISPCPGYRMFTCNFVAPVAALLSVDGFPQMTHGLGYEDCETGKMIERTGVPFRFDPRMMIYESEELHHVGPTMLRSDPGATPNDKSHAFIDRASRLLRWPNHFGPGGLAAVRQRVLAGEPLPIITEPSVEWWTGKDLSEL